MDNKVAAKLLELGDYLRQAKELEEHADVLKSKALDEFQHLLEEEFDIKMDGTDMKFTRRSMIDEASYEGELEQLAGSEEYLLCLTETGRIIRVKINQ